MSQNIHNKLQHEESRVPNNPITSGSVHGPRDRGGFVRTWVWVVGKSPSPVTTSDPPSVHRTPVLGQGPSFPTLPVHLLTSEVVRNECFVFKFLC